MGHCTHKNKKKTEYTFHIGGTAGIFSVFCLFLHVPCLFIRLYPFCVWERLSVCVAAHRSHSFFFEQKLSHEMWIEKCLQFITCLSLGMNLFLCICFRRTQIVYCVKNWAICSGHASLQSPVCYRCRRSRCVCVHAYT